MRNSIDWKKYKGKIKKLIYDFLVGDLDGITI